MKILQIVLFLFILGIVAAVPFAFGGLAFSSAASATSAAPAVSVGSTVQLTNGFQEISIRASPEGYFPASFTVKKGVPVKILFSADRYAGCGRQLLMPEFGINFIAVEGQISEGSFTPAHEGVFSYRCSMNMFRGKMTVVA